MTDNLNETEFREVVTTMSSYGQIEPALLKNVSLVRENPENHNKPTLIGISGVAGSGKDAFAKIMNKVLMDHYCNSKERASADIFFETKKFAYKLKQMAAILTDDSVDAYEDRNQKEEYLPAFGMTRREMLLKLGTEAVRNNVHKNAWVKGLLGKYNGEKYIITDVRFENEAQEIINLGGVLVRIERNSAKGTGHISDTALDGRMDMFSYKINNNYSFNELKSVARYILSDLGIVQPEKTHG